MTDPREMIKFARLESGQCAPVLPEIVTVESINRRTITVSMPVELYYRSDSRFVPGGKAKVNWQSGIASSIEEA